MALSVTRTTVTRPRVRAPIKWAGNLGARRDPSRCQPALHHGCTLSCSTRYGSKSRAGLGRGFLCGDVLRGTTLRENGQLQQTGHHSASARAERRTGEYEKPPDAWGEIVVSLRLSWIVRRRSPVLVSRDLQVPPFHGRPGSPRSVVNTCVSKITQSGAHAEADRASYRCPAYDPRRTRLSLAAPRSSTRSRDR